MTLLASALAAVSDRGWRVGNVDATVVAQQPRLADHLPDIRAALAAGLLVEDDAVSVKATTTDRLGAIGRVEGIACWATVLVVER
jgi:2-C-methyl-D-erythritol 2,4-cyclodiphosphate synthase